MSQTLQTTQLGRLADSRNVINQGLAVQTFLLTDIEGSTRLWEDHPEEMAVALARHDAILNDAIEEVGGQVVKSTGDGILARFAAATDALAAAIGAQHGLGRESWDAIGNLRVRMGIHTGDSEAREGDHFGPTMNRTARIMAAGHGGQVLLSAAAKAMVATHLPPGASCRDLGSHRLKDLTLPEHLFQLLHDGLATEFPPSPLSTPDSTICRYSPLLSLAGRQRSRLLDRCCARPTPGW